MPAANYLLGLEDGKKRFFDLVLAANKAYSLCSTLDEAKQYRKETAFYSAIKAALNKFTLVDHKRAREEKNSALKQILDNAIISEGVADIFALCGLEKPNVGLLSDEFLEDVRRMPHKNLAVEITEKLRKSTTVDWQERDSVRARLKILVRRTLQRWKYPPDKAAEAIELVMEQAEKLSNEWSK